ncbi:MAG: alanine racemase [Patescibacteria group bacterium]|nr:alanine racemase [Patescibacteria group bacterium]
MKKIHTSKIYISKKKFINNYKFIKRVVGKNVRISSVVKGDAYGHGMKQIVPLAEEQGINHFAVFAAFEAKKLLKICRQSSQIMIMGMISNKQLPWAIKNGIEFFIFEFNRLQAACKMAKKMKKPAKIHIEVETGLNRTGFDFKDLDKLLKFLKKNKKHFNIIGLCTHYAGAESIINYYRIKKQIAKYNVIYKKFIKADIDIKYRHTACSAAAINYKQTRMDMVRVGIIQFGLWPSDETLINYLSKRKRKINPLQPILSWKTKILNTKVVKAGDFIGYGDTFMANKNMKIATMPVGYACGYSCSLSNRGNILINGKRANIIGKVNMNLSIVNITHIPEVKKGDEVVLIGQQDNDEIHLTSFRDIYNSLNYELLTRLPFAIPRIIID